MKISKTFSLEEDVLESIEKYQKEKKLSSLSSALERIILIELPKRTDLEEIKNMINNISIVQKNNIDNSREINKENEECVAEIENSEIYGSIQDSLNSMED